MLTLLLQGLLLLFFAARDLVVFTVFWEAMLIPLYFLINLFGGEKRQEAAYTFILYMIGGSCLLVASVLALYLGVGSFNLDVLKGASSSLPYAPWIFGALLLAFAVKTPLFPFHAWLPETYCQASTAGTILLSGILSKAGIYGILRIGYGLFPALLQAWQAPLLGLAIGGVFYGGLCAWRQNDFKRLIAYSSFSHVNFILVGLFVVGETATTGALLQAFNHSITIASLFLVAGWLENKLGSTRIGPFSGVAKELPRLCWLTLFFVLSSVALPGTNNFVGELLIFFGLYVKQPWAACFLVLTVVLSVIYMLRWMQSVYFGDPKIQAMEDISGRDLVKALPFITLILWVGIYPSPLLKLISEVAS